jgi:RNA recognition motif-containing protein
MRRLFTDPNEAVFSQTPTTSSGSSPRAGGRASNGGTTSPRANAWHARRPQLELGMIGEDCNDGDGMGTSLYTENEGYLSSLESPTYLYPATPSAHGGNIGENGLLPSMSEEDVNEYENAAPFHESVVPAGQTLTNKPMLQLTHLNNFTAKEDVYHYCIKGHNFYGQQHPCRCRNCLDEAMVLSQSTDTPNSPTVFSPMWSRMDSWADHQDTPRSNAWTATPSKLGQRDVQWPYIGGPQTPKTPKTPGSVTKKKSPNSKKKSFNLDQASPIEYRDQDQFFDFLKRAQDQEELTGIPADAASPRSTDIMPLSPKASSGNTSPSNRTVSSGGSPSSRKSKKRRELRENQKTTVMLRNIPNKYEQQQLLEVMASKGFPTQTFDFFYLPIDFRNRCCVGYAFINFHTNDIAVRFERIFSGFKLPMTNVSPKICQVNFARIQGRQANIDVYRNSALAGVPIKEYRPLCFNEKGEEIPLPTPDAPLPSVQLRAAKIHRGSKRKREKAKKMQWGDAPNRVPNFGFTGLTPISA